MFIVRYNDKDNRWKVQETENSWFNDLKGLSYEMDFCFWGHAWSALGLNRGRGQFFYFLVLQVFYNSKSEFLAVIASLHGLIILLACTYSRFFASYWSAGFGTILQVSVLASPCLEDCANFTPTPEENYQYSANHCKCNTRIMPINFFNFYQWTIILQMR